MKIHSLNFIFLLIVVISITGIVTAELSSDPSRSIVTASENTAGGTRLALVVGVGDYKKLDDNLFNRLSPPDVRDVLIDTCEFDQVLMLTDDQATKASIKSKINQLAMKSTPSSIVVFYFIGHGSYYSGKSYICPYNSLLDSYENDISDADLKNWLDLVPAQNVLVIIDSCESGGFSPNSLTKSGTASKESFQKSDGTLDTEQFMEQFGRTFTGIPDTSTIQSATITPNAAIKGSRYTVMMASKSNEDSFSTNVHGGVFTYYILQGLQQSSTDTNMDDWVSAEEAFRYAAPKTSSYLKSKQNPRMYDGDPSHDILLAGESNTDPIPTGAISLTSTPSGATVYLDGVNKGVTPITLTGIPIGNHQVKFTKSTYQDYITNVIVTTGTTKYVSATLTQIPSSSGSRFTRGVSPRAPIRR